MSERFPTPENDPLEMLKALTRTVQEEAETLRKLVDDEDSDCLVRDLRAERLAALDWVLRAFRNAEVSVRSRAENGHPGAR